MSESPLESPVRTAAANSLNYTRSLLKIKTPIVVTLASTSLSVSRILDLAPGAIIQFEKSYDEPLTLEVGGQAVAVGEAVKVGEKFGLRVTAIILPAERFVPLARPSSTIDSPSPQGSKPLATAGRIH